MSIPADANPNLTYLLDELLDGDLQGNERNQLATLIRNEPSARKRYFEQFSIHALMQWELAAPLTPKPLTVGASSRQFAPTKSRVLPVLIAALKVPLRPQVWSTLCVALAFYGGFVYMAWSLRPENGQTNALHLDGVNGPGLAASNQDEIAPHAAATLIAENGCRWKGERPSASGKVGGKAIVLEAGVAEIEFNDGTVVVLEAPCAFNPREGGRGFLTRGTIGVRVPPTAIGFTVETPSAKVVDLGTEFAVRVDDEGSTDVQVLVGKVALRPNQGDQQSATPAEFVLRAGMGKRVEVATDGLSPAVRESTWKPKRLRLKTEDPSQSIVIQSIRASSEHPRHRAINLLANGDSRWRTMNGRSHGEFLWFDFGTRRRLDSANLWNYKNPAQRDADVAKLKIYVSDTGEADPLTRPDAWSWVGSDSKWGAASSSQPHVIRLGGIVTRFVALVVDESLPQKAEQGDIWVGMSKVQFFGNPRSSQIISGMTAIVSSVFPEAPLRTADMVVSETGIHPIGSDLAVDGAFVHDNNPDHAWTCGRRKLNAAIGESITIDLQSHYDLEGMRIWNFNHDVAGLDAGISVYHLETSADGRSWEMRQRDRSLAKASGRSADDGIYTVVKWPKVRYVRITIVDTYRGLDDIAGLSEVMFHGKRVSE